MPNPASDADAQIRAECLGPKLKPGTHVDQVLHPANANGLFLSPLPTPLPTGFWYAPTQIGKGLAVSHNKTKLASR